MHEVYIAMELTIYIFNFNPSINEIVFIASKKERALPVAGFEPVKVAVSHCWNPLSSPLGVSFIIEVALYAILTCAFP